MMAPNNLCVGQNQCLQLRMLFLLPITIRPSDVAKEFASGKTRKRLSFQLVCCLFVLALVIIASLLWVDEQCEGHHFTPT